MSARPFAPGSVSLRVYPSDADAVSIVEEMREQARLAEASGFDGLMTSEHHGGFPGYIPNPLQQAGWLLEATERIWAAPAPLRPLEEGHEDGILRKKTTRPRQNTLGPYPYPRTMHHRGEAGPP